MTDERRDLLATLIEEVIEDIGLRKAMEEASDSPPATRAEVFKILTGDE